MKYRDAKKLHNEDEVISKKTGRLLTVISVKVDDINKDVFILCQDGNTYHHKDIK